MSEHHEAGPKDWANWMSEKGLDADAAIHKRLYPSGCPDQNCWICHTGQRPKGFDSQVTAAMTQTQLLREAERLPDNSTILHEWPDGWSIRQPNSFLDHHREGVLMSNCYDADHPDRHSLWNAYEPDKHALPSREFIEQEINKAAPAETYSLRDPDNIPHLTVDGDLIGTDDAAAYGRHNSDPKPEYVQRWKEFENLPGAATLLPVDFSGPRLANKRMLRKSDYNGWTNWDTWNTHLMMDNEPHHHQFMERNLDRLTPEGLRDYAIENVIGPANRETMNGAQEWNSIPMDERFGTDPDYEDLRERAEGSPAWNLMGADPEEHYRDVDPNNHLVDPEMVNWNEIHDHWLDRAGYHRDQPDDLDAPGNETFPAEWNDRLSRIQAAMWRAIRRQR